MSTRKEDHSSLPLGSSIAQLGRLVLLVLAGGTVASGSAAARWLR